MEPSELIKQVKLRPAIWAETHRDDKKIATAWRQICKIAWPDFHTRSVDEKRTKCLDLQKQWKTLQMSYTRERNRQQSPRGQTSSKGQYYNQLSFLAIVDKCRTPGSNKGPSNATAATTSTSSTPSSTAPTPAVQDRGADADEDRQFLLSLVSFMQDVPRSSKLALRTEIMQAIAKYSGQDSKADPIPPMSQEY